MSKYNCAMRSVRIDGMLNTQSGFVLSSRLTLIYQFYKDTPTIPEGI